MLRGTFETGQTRLSAGRMPDRVLFHEGLGVQKDLEKSFYWTKRAAKHGDRDARNNLADLFYEKGAVVEKDIEKATELYKKAALNGHREALEKCRLLGVSDI